MATHTVRVSSKKRQLTIKKPSKIFRKEDILINFIPYSFNRRSNFDLETEIDQIWKKKVAQNSKLFNGSKFRHADHRMTSDGKLEIDVGLTCYKDLVGTNLREDVDKLEENGVKVHGSSHAYLSQPLAVGIILLSSDDHIVVLKRSKWTGECPGMHDRPGGHPEPSEVKNLSKYLRKDEVDTEKVNLAIRDELFSSIAREAKDEVGLTEPIEVFLSGFTQSADMGDRPTVEFIARVQQSSEELKTLYDKGEHSEAEESTDIWLMSPQEMKTLYSMIQTEFSCSGDAPSPPEDTEDLIPSQTKYLKNLLKDNFTPALTASLILAYDFIFNKKDEKSEGE